MPMMKMTATAQKNSRGFRKIRRYSPEEKKLMYITGMGALKYFESRS
jgi:hypothetical protein